MNFITSPEVAVGLAIGGSLGFDPRRDRVPDSGGAQLQPPSPAPEVPASGFIARGTGYIAPNGESDPIEVDPESSRLQLLEPFAARAPDQFADMAVLLKAVGQCTTDHISPAGPWLRFRGHLDNISDNMFLGANNAFADQPGHGPDLAGDGRPKPLPEVARNLAAAGTQLGRRRGRELRRRVLARARRDVAAAAWRGRCNHALICANSRNEP